MEVLVLEITSPLAIFKKNETRGKWTDSTFSHIHVNAIKGIVGATIGLEGYNLHSLKKKLKLTKEELPEFYTKLRDLKVSIVPITENGDFEKHYETFTESQGFYGSDGNTLIVKEQQIVGGKWEIYLELSKLEKEVAEKIKTYFLEGRTVFIPYMGKNEHFANISNVRIEKIKKEEKKQTKIDSIALKEEGEEFDVYDFDSEATFFLEEYMPVKLNEDTGRYILKEIVYTDFELSREHYITEKNKKIVFI